MSTRTDVFWKSNPIFHAFNHIYIIISFICRQEHLQVWAADASKQLVQMKKILPGDCCLWVPACVCACVCVWVGGRLSVHCQIRVVGWKDRQTIYSSSDVSKDLAINWPRGNLPGIVCLCVCVCLCVSDKDRERGGEMHLEGKKSAWLVGQPVGGWSERPSLTHLLSSFILDCVSGSCLLLGHVQSNQFPAIQCRSKENWQLFTSSNREAWRMQQIIA